MYYNKMRSELKRENKKLRVCIYVMLAIIIWLLYIIYINAKQEPEIWNEGFNSCIEENNLYGRYPNYKGDNRWVN